MAAEAVGFLGGHGDVRLIHQQDGVWIGEIGGPLEVAGGAVTARFDDVLKSLRLRYTAQQEDKGEDGRD